MHKVQFPFDHPAWGTSKMTFQVAPNGDITWLPTTWHDPHILVKDNNGNEVNVTPFHVPMTKNPDSPFESAEEEDAFWSEYLKQRFDK